MKDTRKTKEIKRQNVSWSFSSRRLTLFSGAAPIFRFFDKLGLISELESRFHTVTANATKYRDSQLMLAVILASMCGISHLSRIAVFTADVLVRTLLGLPKGLNKDVISVRFKALGQRGARLLEELNGQRLRRRLENLALESVTLDADSTVKTVYGQQEGAAVGYNPHKKGAKSYHPLLLFLNDAKLVVNSWFRTGSAYTSNGVVDFLNQSAAFLTGREHVFFRADSGFFAGALFDRLEEMGWEYLIKVKLKGLKELLASRTWLPVAGRPEVWVCEFTYQCRDWSRARTFKAVRRIEEYEQKLFFGRIEWIPVYEYACYCTNRNMDAIAAHECYKQRSTSENWIEQVKNQLAAGMTLTDDFWANDILWQLCVSAYNLSVMMRLGHKELHRQEHRTFREWFIMAPGELYRLRQPELRLYEHYLFKEQWRAFADSLTA